MTENILYHAAMAAMTSGSIFALVFSRKPRIAGRGACLLLLIGAVLAAVPVCAGFGSSMDFFFQLPILILSAAGGIHSLGYLRGHGEERAGLYWFFFNLTAAAMLGVTFCYEKLPFLVMWEFMGLASFFLTVFDYRSVKSVRAGWIYLLACQGGAMFLMLLMVFGNLGALTAFVLAVLGFGLKIGFPLLHIWLPEAHPAAPSPVSALMSGAMIQLGFLGLLRWGIGTDAALFPVYGYTLLALGMAGALGGILFALPQNNLKRLLAYSSIENMGIIAIGFGFGFLGAGYGLAGNSAAAILLAFLGFGGAGFHMLNHALLKGGLFLGAGSVQQAAGTLDMNRMGGLLRKMPWTGSLFLLNSIGLSGLPPFNAFLSEFLLYFCGLAAVFMASGNPVFRAVSVAAVIVMALTGGLASAAFAKASGGTFLGLPRTPEAENATERPWCMILPIGLLFAGSLAAVMLAPWLLSFSMSFLNRICFPDCAETVQLLAPFDSLLKQVVLLSGSVLMLFSLLMLIRFRLLPRGRENRRTGTWDCGYAAPDSRMEYTADAFSQPLMNFFRFLLRTDRKIQRPEGEFPGKSSYEDVTPDPGLAGFWEGLFNRIGRLAERVHFLQSGYLHLYILIATATLIAMLVWGLILPWSGTLLMGR